MAARAWLELSPPGPCRVEDGAALLPVVALARFQAGRSLSAITRCFSANSLSIIGMVGESVHATRDVVVSSIAVLVTGVCLKTLKY
jgi:hypothetical protein